MRVEQIFSTFFAFLKMVFIWMWTLWSGNEVVWSDVKCRISCIIVGIFRVNCDYLQDLLHICSCLFVQDFLHIFWYFWVL